MKTHICTQLALVTALGLTGTAQAALQGRDLVPNEAGFEGFYDTDINIIWLANRIGSIATWSVSDNAANSFLVVDSVNNITYDNWRLPSIGELDHLFYSELGGVAGTSIIATHNTNYDLFPQQTLAGLFFLTSTPPDVFSTLIYRFDYGSAYTINNPNFEAYSLIVSNGDITAVPEADTWAMVLAGLGLVGVAARRTQLAAWLADRC